MMSRDDEKYKWDWKNQIFPTIDPHSKIKHSVFDEYLQTYIKILMQNPLIPKLRLSIVDGFCGGGQYLDADNKIHFGSPILALQAVQSVIAEINIGRKQPREVQTKNFFVDISPENIQCLRAVLEMQNQAHRIGHDIYLECNDFSKALPNIIGNVKSFGDRALFLLDQYAYGDVPFDDIRTIFSSVKNAEVLLTFNVDSLITYLSDRQTNRKAVENIGLERHIPWAELKSLKANRKHDWQYLIQRCLSKGILMESGAEFMTIFFITPLGSNPRTYWFIHLANSYRANDVMKSIHWQYGNNFSHMLSPSLFVGYDANRDATVTQQEGFEYGEEHNFDGVTSSRIHNELSELLPRQIYSCEGQTFGDLMCGMANFTMADERLVKRSLSLAVEVGDLEVRDRTGKKTRRKGSSIEFSDVILAPPQRPLFFMPSSGSTKNSGGNL